MKHHVLGFVALAACQAVEEPAPSSVSQEVGSGAYCATDVPAAHPWTGGALPASTPTTVVLVSRGQTAWTAYGADPADAKVRWAVSIESKYVASFMNVVGSSVQPYGGVRPPNGGHCPQICGDGDGAYLLEIAARILPIEKAAAAAAAVCN
jgi:hypothetical protein